MNTYLKLLGTILLILTIGSVSAAQIDTTIQVTFTKGGPSGVYETKTVMDISDGDTVRFNVPQYPNGKWNTDALSTPIHEVGGSEHIEMTFTNLQGIYHLTYEVPGIYPPTGVPATLELILNIENSGGDLYADSLYAKNPQYYTIITSDDHPRLSFGGTVAEFTFGSEQNAPYIRKLTVKTDGQPVKSDAKIHFIPEKSANPVTSPNIPYTLLYDMKSENIPIDSVTEVRFVFGVPSALISSEGYNPGYDVELLRYSKDSWKTLPTYFVEAGTGSNAGLDWYEAVSEGFSYYAVGMEKDVTRSFAPEVSTVTKTPTTQVTETQPTLETPSTPVPSAPYIPTPPEESSLGIFAGVFAVGCVFAGMRKR